MFKKKSGSGVTREQKYAREFFEHDEPFTRYRQPNKHGNDATKKEVVDTLDACTCDRKLSRCCDDHHCGLYGK